MSGPQPSLTMNRTRDCLRGAGISNATFSEIIDVPVASWKSMLSGRQHVPAETEAGYYEISARLMKFVEALRPAVIVDAKVWRKLLESKSPEEIQVWREQMFKE